MAVHFGPPAGLMLESETTKDFHFVGMPPGTVLLTPMSVRIQCQRKRPWQQNDVSRRGLPCAAAFACTDYKVHLYVQLSRCPTLDGIMLISKARARDLVDNRVPEEMSAAQARLEDLRDWTVGEALSWLGDEH
ncbi:hypothetical protein HIM_11825 [Hirsutella minnesotensis 3608]|uniref:Uncharacterized protein n=1 Tax=Hirsutella minnesotensis 3608 TaxID=1043627 RepID=A0A0F7ZFA1_9HYPO|nr:hypothetical protein HIM_11825 [Hirsutella minnesotensis 3608]